LQIFQLAILEKIKLLHENDIIIGDINPFNILIKDDKTVYFVDVDSYQVDNYPCPVGTVHFTAPRNTKCGLIQ
jgi:DNA-binding helix-hairpin-helix protein with protein kinase domain